MSEILGIFIFLQNLFLQTAFWLLDRIKEVQFFSLQN